MLTFRQFLLEFASPYDRQIRLGSAIYDKLLEHLKNNPSAILPLKDHPEVIFDVMAHDLDPGFPSIAIEGVNFIPRWKSENTKATFFPPRKRWLSWIGYSGRILIYLPQFAKQKATPKSLIKALDTQNQRAFFIHELTHASDFHRLLHRVGTFKGYRIWDTAAHKAYDSRPMETRAWERMLAWEAQQMRSKYKKPEDLLGALVLKYLNHFQKIKNPRIGGTVWQYIQTLYPPKEIRVRTYRKHDGTRVKAHLRHRPQMEKI